MNHSMKPGQPLYDTEGKRVQAHGGSIFYEESTETYYFYGENKEFTTDGSDVWTWGVRAYASKDLYNWEDKGLIIEPVEDDSTSSLNPRTAMLDRPHIIYNEATKKYVCWCKIMWKDNTQTELVLTADSFLGPYTVVRDHLRPLNMDAGDFDLAVASDGKAYYMFERVHSETIVADLTDDYTDVTGYYSTHFPHSHPPYVREATAHFMWNHRHYLLTSGTTWYLPNPSEVAVADSWHGPYKVLGDPCPEDQCRTTFHSQVSSVFKVPGKKNLYIALADRWCPDAMDVPYGFYAEAIESFFAGSIDQSSPEEYVAKLAGKYGVGPEMIAKASNMARDTSVAEYVWLPLKFVEPCEKYPDGMVLLEWKDEWRIEDYE